MTPEERLALRIAAALAAGFAGGRRPLRDEEHFPAVLARRFPEAADDAVFDLFQRRPELGGGFDGVPDDVVVPAHRARLGQLLARLRCRVGAPGSGGRHRPLGGRFLCGAPFGFLFFFSRFRLRLRVLRLIGPEEAVFDLVERGRQVRDGAIHIDCDAQRVHLSVFSLWSLVFDL